MWSPSELLAELVLIFLARGSHGGMHITGVRHVQAIAGAWSCEQSRWATTKAMERGDGGGARAPE